MSITTVAVQKLRNISELLRSSTAVVIAPTESSDGAGGLTQVWATAAIYSARVSPVATVGGERKGLIADALQDRTAFQISLPFDTHLDLNYRIVLNSKQYDILAISDTYDYLVEVSAIIAQSLETVSYT